MIALNRTSQVVGETLIILCPLFFESNVTLDIGAIHVRGVVELVLLTIAKEKIELSVSISSFAFNCVQLLLMCLQAHVSAQLGLPQSRAQL